MKSVAWNDIAKLLDRVLAAVVQQIHAGPSAELPKRIQQSLRLEPTSFGAYIDTLSNAADTVKAVRNVDDLRATGPIEAMLNRPSLPADRFDEVVTDLLTGLWLAMYFVGVPIGSAWERAVQIAEGGGGFPHGACANKAIGDVYRSARLIYRAEFMPLVRQVVEKAPQPGGVVVCGEIPRELVAPPRVVVFTRRPRTLLVVEAGALTQCKPTLTLLGRYYAQFQLKLYAEAGLPITYMVSLAAVEELLALPAGEFAALSASVQAVLGASSRPGQSIVVAHEQTATLGIPTCVLGHNRGIYTLTDSEANRDAIPFAGNRFGSEMTAAYRTRLIGLSGAQVRWSGVDDLKMRLEDARNLLLGGTAR